MIEIILNISATVLVLLVLTAMILDKMKPMPVLIFAAAQLLVFQLLHIAYDILGTPKCIVSFVLMWVFQIVFTYIRMRVENKVSARRRLRRVLRYVFLMYIVFTIVTLY